MNPVAPIAGRALIAAVALAALFAGGCLDPIVGYPCERGLTACGEECVDLALSYAHCGACDNSCPGACVRRRCLPPGSEPAGDVSGVPADGAGDQGPGAGSGQDRPDLGAGAGDGRTDAPSDARSGPDAGSSGDTAGPALAGAGAAAIDAASSDTGAAGHDGPVLVPVTR
jgi:hypothetical protein